jgi:hypothetical protein
MISKSLVLQDNNPNDACSSGNKSQIPRSENMPKKRELKKKFE